MASQFPDYPTPGGKPKSSNTWLWIVLGVIGGGVALSCVCCGGLSYVGISGASKMFEEVAKAQFNDDPIIQEKLGGITSASMNLTATGEEGKKKEGSLVLDVTGPKGKGQLIMQGGNPEHANSAVLRINGQDFEIKAHNHGDHDHAHDEAMPDNATPVPPTEPTPPGEPTPPAP